MESNTVKKQDYLLNKTYLNWLYEEKFKIIEIP